MGCRPAFFECFGEVYVVVLTDPDLRAIYLAVNERQREGVGL